MIQKYPNCKIHPSAIISDGVILGDGVEIGAFSVIGENVVIKDNTILKSHVVVEGHSEIGCNNIIYPFAVIGVAPQDLKFNGENSKVIIGDNNKIREHVTIHRGTKDGGSLTQIGNNCLLMVGVHIAHDCKLGNSIILANNATLAGHVEVEDNVVIGGLSAVHQFVRIGRGAMIGGMSGVENDIIPYGMVIGERASLEGLNIVGMKRHNIDREEIHGLRNFFKKIFKDKNLNFSSRVENYGREFTQETVKEVVNFVKSKSNRAFCQPKNFNDKDFN